MNMITNDLGHVLGFMAISHNFSAHAKCNRLVRIIIT
jgi:hypothetical protein